MVDGAGGGIWPAVWDYFGVRSATPYERMLSGSVMPDVQWFTGAQVSYAEHLFRGRDPERVALIDARESAQPGAGPVSRHLTWGMLREQVGDLAAMLRELGVRPGDVVAGYVPNAAEAVIAFLATASLGPPGPAARRDRRGPGERPEGEYWMPLFVVLNPGHELDDALTGKIRQAIRAGASPRHVPDEIIAVPGIPHTRTGKKLEIPVKRILQGGDPRQVMDAGAVDNPDALRWFAAYQTRTPIP